MSAECYPVSVLPNTTRLYADFLSMGEVRGDSNSGAGLEQWYGADPASGAWMLGTARSVDARGLADALTEQSTRLGVGEKVFANIERLRSGARAVVTGQQVGLFGGPLLTLLKAATAVVRAREATATTGVDHVPMFWLASEDHDLEEVDQITLPSRHALEQLRLGLRSDGQPVGELPLGAEVEALLEQVGELLGYAPIWETLRSCYTPDTTLAVAFARLMARLFAADGLVVVDASEEAFHRLGQPVFRQAIERADELEQLLLERGTELEGSGYHIQVLVKPGASLLFLIDAETGIRQVLRRSGAAGGDALWKAGSKTFSQSELLLLLEQEPARFSPNALLRPVFQDAILPTVAYIGGPAEIAYFAQSGVLYEALLDRVTPILPRFSATLIEPAIGTVMQKDEISLKDILQAKTVEALTQRLGARAMPIEGKRRLAAVGNAMDTELGALTSYLESLDASLGRSAGVSANKMRYQMNRLRRMAATFEVQKEASLRRHAEAMMLHLLPDAHPQERVIGGIFFLAQAGEELIDRLVDEASRMCLGHEVIRL